MPKKLYVYSTLTADQRYTNYTQGGADMPVPAGAVFVKGGAGVANDRIQTPRGVATEITADDLKILEANSDFLLHKENGFIEVSEEKVDPEQAAADMESRDGGAPLVPADLPAGDLPKGTDAGEALPPLPPLGNGPVVPPAAHGGKKR